MVLWLFLYVNSFLSATYFNYFSLPSSITYCNEYCLNKLRTISKTWLKPFHSIALIKLSIYILYIDIQFFKVWTLFTLFFLYSVQSSFNIIYFFFLKQIVTFLFPPGHFVRAYILPRKDTAYQYNYSQTNYCPCHWLLPTVV